MILDIRSGVAKVCPQCGEVKLIADFNDRSLITGRGRFCKKCKTKVSTSFRGHTEATSSLLLELRNEPSRGDVNKLVSFTRDPRKYATGTVKAREKVEYLESIKGRFTEKQLAAYRAARFRYDAEITQNEKRALRQEDLTSVLIGALNNQKSVRICYKNSWRIIDPYSVDSTYVVAYCHLASDIRTFRIDRVQGAEVLEGFNFDASLHATAQLRLAGAPNYYKGR
jgi:hypothetical protein